MRPLGVRWSARIVAALGFTLIALAAVAISASAEDQNTVPRSITMQELTVPADRLSEGCHLKAAPPPQMSSGRVLVQVLSAGEVATNPWIGDDRKTIAAIRQSIDGAPRLPDGPLPTRSEMSDLRSQEAEGVEEGYAAVYEQPDRPDIAIQALRFSGARDTVEIPRSQRSQSRITARMWLGPVLVVLQGDDGRCSATIRTYLESLAR